MPLPPLRNPPRSSRALERGTVGSARVWSPDRRQEEAARHALDAGSLPPNGPSSVGRSRERLKGLELRHPALARRLRMALSGSELAPSNHGEILERVLSWIDESMGPDPSAAGSAASPAEDARILEILERRLAKLRHSLRTARELHRGLARMKDHDPGIASIYRAVQGLAEMDALLEIKREMLREIFQANLALQRRTA